MSKKVKNVEMKLVKMDDVKFNDVWCLVATGN